MGKYDPRNIAIPSSGDPERDQREIDDFITSSIRIDEGLCPNHPKDPSFLVEVETGEWQCPREDCPFVLFKRTLHV